ncbi:hypothetical protein, partial [Enterobacter hormaechei]|uniref:hypothetical protein n=1 Tax=Enterobacter hormaechei TaxID=158836 RepID=UPI00203CCE42
MRPITASMPSSSMGGGGAAGNVFNTTLNITQDGTSSSQQGSGSQGHQLQQSMTQWMNRWAVDNLRPGGLL